jgi:H3 lysine-79-specific histone-lysine N-methyltransferase
MFSSDEEDGGSSDVASGSDISRKRIKSSVSSVDSGGPRRILLAEEAFIEDPAPIKIIHGLQITSGKDQAKFKNPWSDPEFETVRLQYPSRSPREKFELKMPRSEYNEYQPLEDIKETIFTICNFYFPPELEAMYNSEELDTGFQRRFSRAAVHRDIDEFIDIVKDFNRILDGLIKDGRIKHELLSHHSLHLDWTKRILDQIYARTVSPAIETLRAYENGTDNVYGELLTNFVSKILQQTHLTHDQVFIDLGSGVGNVVLQAALECGAESWGIEMMPNPAVLAKLQAREFRARTRLWGLSAGAVHLLQGDFTSFPANKPVLEVLARADVVLVNNQAFTPSLNDKLRDMFLDLKDGCRVVSLKPFVPEGHKITNRNVGSVVNLFVQEKFQYFSNSVSWTDQMGCYYIARKDKRPLEAFLRRNGGVAK